jgi:hypothetical protein
VRRILTSTIIGVSVGLLAVPALSATAAPRSAPVSGHPVASHAVSGHPVVTRAVSGQAVVDRALSLSLPSSRAVTLLTGDSVVLRTAGHRTSASVRAADRSGPQGQFLAESLAGHTYVLPSEVRPFVGSVLDPSLFDVAALAAASSAGRIPVTVTAPAGSVIDLPGFTATSHSGAVSTGYLATSSAAALRNDLISAWRRVVAPGAVAPTALFGGVTHLSLTGAVSPVQPAFPQVTLIIKVLNASGRPSPEGFIGLVNTDDSRKFATFVPYYNGEVRVSLPYGHYGGITDDASFTATSFVDRLVPIADYTVSRNLQTLTFDARTATVRPSVQTPAPASLNTLSLEFDRGSGRGGIGSIFLYGAGSQVYVAPTPTARYGQLHWLTTWSLAGPTSGAQYSYDLSYLNTGSVPARQGHTVTSGQLATVHARYYSEKRRTAEFVRTPYYPFQDGIFSEFAALPTPEARTEYINAPPSAVWLDQLLAYPSDDNPFGGFFLDGPRIYQAGSTRAVDWLRGPLAPATAAPTEGDAGFFCPACRTANKLGVDLAPVTDTTPGHVGYLDEVEGHGPVASFVLYRNGVRVGGGQDVTGGLFTVPPGSATYRIHATTDRRADSVLTSTTTSTDWTFRSGATGGAPLPAGWDCGIGTSTHCTVLPLLRATVPLPTSLSDTLPVGTTTFDFTVARVAGATPSAVTAATLSTSSDGTTFHPAKVVALGHGTFRATVVNGSSLAGHGVSLQVTASDAAGSSITQTVTNAYQVASN